MNYNDETKAVRNFIIIFLIVLFVVIGLYFFTAKVVKKDSTDTKSEEAVEIKIDNSVAIVGTMFNKIEDDYYVILYKSDSDKVTDYKSLVTKYQKEANHLPVYTVDLSNALNTQYYDPSNVSLNNDKVTDMRFGDFTVLEVKKHKVFKSYESVEKVEKAWKLS